MSAALAEEALYLKRKAEVWNEDEKNWRGEWGIYRLEGRKFEVWLRKRVFQLRLVSGHTRKQKRESVCA